MIANTVAVYKNSSLSFRKTGAGKKLLFAFHGFGQDNKSFDLLANRLYDDYTVYSFDLFFHGKSEWGYDEQPLEKVFWKNIMQTVITENEITKFSVVGFSLGCRFAMATVEEFYTRIEAVFLIAPDGIKTSFWYSLSTYPILLRKIFKSMIAHPARFKVIVNTLHELRLMNKGLLKFAEHQMNTKEKRKKVYYSWVVFRHLKFGLKNFTQVITENKIALTIIVGRQDHVITAKNMKGFIKLLPQVNFQILNTGHAGLLKDPTLISIFRTKHV